MSPVDRYSTYRDSTIHDEDARTSARHISRRRSYTVPPLKSPKAVGSPAVQLGHFNLQVSSLSPPPSSSKLI